MRGRRWEGANRREIAKKNTADGRDANSSHAERDGGTKGFFPSLPLVLVLSADVPVRRTKSVNGKKKCRRLIQRIKRFA